MMLILCSVVANESDYQIYLPQGNLIQSKAKEVEEAHETEPEPEQQSPSRFFSKTVENTGTQQLVA